MSVDDVKRKLAAILSADVKGYSRLMGEDELATVATLTEYRSVMSALIHQYRGRVIDSPGDNLLAEFPSVVDAVQSAVAIQKEFRSRNENVPENRRMEYRIGINLGDVIEEGGRLYGDGVNLAARLEGLADAGGICISRTAFDQIEDKLPLGYEYLGEQTVKNIVKPVRAYRVIIDPGDKTAARRKAKRAAPGPPPTHETEPEIESAPGRKKKKRHYDPAGERRRFISHLGAYGGVICFLFIINMITSPDSLWFFWPALGWGLAVAIHAVNIFIPGIERTKTGQMDVGRKYRKTPPKFRFYRHLAVYGIVIIFLFIINMITSSSSIWFHWPALGWGLFLFINAIKVFTSSSDK